MMKKMDAPAGGPGHDTQLINSCFIRYIKFFVTLVTLTRRGESYHG